MDFCGANERLRKESDTELSSLSDMEASSLLGSGWILARLEACSSIESLFPPSVSSSNLRFTERFFFEAGTVTPAFPVREKAVMLG